MFEFNIPTYHKLGQSNENTFISEKFGGCVILTVRTPVFLLNGSCLPVSVDSAGVT
jgi:hypothetical protein